MENDHITAKENWALENYLTIASRTINKGKGKAFPNRSWRLRVKKAFPLQA
jgi:hypothetical protein